MFDPVGKYLASQSDDKTMRVWRTSDWSQETIVEKPFAEAGATTPVLRLLLGLNRLIKMQLLLFCRLIPTNRLKMYLKNFDIKRVSPTEGWSAYKM